MCYLFKIFNQLHIFHEHNSIWALVGEQAAAHFSIDQIDFQYRLKKIRMQYWRYYNAFAFLNMKRLIRSDAGREREIRDFLSATLQWFRLPLFLSIWQSVSPEPQLKLLNRSVWQLLNKMDSRKKERKIPQEKRREGKSMQGRDFKIGEMEGLGVEVGEEKRESREVREDETDWEGEIPSNEECNNWKACETM